MNRTAGCLQQTSWLARKLAVPLFAIAFGTSCVSVNIGPGKVERSNGVKLTEPASGFKSIKSERADGAWNRHSTGSTIAYQSSCGDTAESPLESLAEDLFAGFENRKQLKAERVPFDGREALDVETEGKVDGVVTRVRAVIYRKNQCTYIITFVTLPKSLMADTSAKPDPSNGDASEFSKFLSNFKAP